MDLALELGCTYEELRSRMTERELYHWVHYAAKWLLPSQRLNVQLAQLTMWIARLAPGATGDLEVEDFMVPPPQSVEKEPAMPTVAELQQAFEFKPRKKLRSVA